MTTTTAFQPFNPVAAMLARDAKTARVARLKAPVRPTHPAPLWQQTLRVNQTRSLIERIVTLMLILIAAVAIVYSAVVMVQTFEGNRFEQAVAKIASHDGR